MNCFLINTRAHSCLGTEPPSRIALEFHRRIVGYSETPLHNCAKLCSEIGLCNIFLKYESDRFGLPAFKILGASWAIYNILAGFFDLNPASNPDFESLKKRLQALSDVRFVTATDGNHGWGVARVARWFGAKAKIFVPEGTHPTRINAIRSEGAEVIVVQGSYDETVKVAADFSGGNKFLIQDTSWDGYEEIPGWITEGYSTMMWEIEDALQQNPDDEYPDLVIVPVGVGSLAAAVIAHFKATGRKKYPKILGVEPLSADCALQSLKADKLVTVPSESSTEMAGLNCGTPSTIAWELIRDGMDAAVAIEDQWAELAVKKLSGQGIHTAESGASATGALLALNSDPSLKELQTALNLNRNGSVLVYVTEGVTNPESYEDFIR
ncbi:diaminopropionate ammonia-lyase [Calditrichota bacterium]